MATENEDDTPLTDEEFMLTQAGYDFLIEVISQNRVMREQIKALTERLTLKKEEDH